MKPDDFTILRLWRRGYDTKTIADHIGCHEAVVANALARIFSKAREAA